MKILLGIMVLSTLGFGQITAYVTDRTAQATYASLNAYLSAKGGLYVSPTFSGGVLKVIGKCIVPSNVDLFALSSNFKFIGNTGSATDTVYISHMTAHPTSQIFDTSVTVLFASGCVDEVKPEWFGAKGDGLTDDTKAWKALIRSLPGTYSGTSYTYKDHATIICNPAISYKISDTINISEKWNLTLRGVGRNFSRDTSSHRATFSWYGGTNNPILFSDYNYGLNIENISIDGRHVSGVIGASFSVPTTTNSSVKFCNIKNLDVSYCDIGIRLGSDTSNQAPDDAAVIVEGGYYGNNTTCALYINSGNGLTTLIGNHCTNNGFAPTGSYKGCNIFFGGGQLKIYGYESAGSGSTACKDADIYQAFGGLSIYSAWSDCVGKFLVGGSNSEGGVLKHIRHWSGPMTDANTPISIDVHNKNTLEGCYLFGDVFSRTGAAGNITMIGGDQFVPASIYTTRRPDSGIGRVKGDLVTTYNALLDLNPTGNASRIMAGGGSRTSFGPKNSNAFLGLFNKDLVENIGGAAGNSGYTITGPNVSNGGFEIDVNCYSTDGTVNYKAYTKGYGLRYIFGYNGLSMLKAVFNDTTTNKLGSAFTTTFREFGTGDTTQPNQNCVSFPWHNGGNAFSSSAFWRGGMLYDTSSNHVLLSRSGSNQFTKLLVEGDSTISYLNFLDSTKTPIVHDKNGKGWRLKVSVTGAISADSNGVSSK